MKKIFLTFILIFIATILFGADSTTVLELPELLSPDINDYIIIVDSSGTPATKRISVPLFIGYIEAMVLDTLDVHDMGIDTLNVTSGVGALDVTSIIVDTVAITKATLGTVYDSVYFEQVNTDSFEIGGTAVTSTADELNILDGVTSSADELNYLDILTEGNVEGSKAIIADANKDIDFKGGDITATNITAETITSNGQITQETYVIRKVVSQTGMTDNTATSIFTITTTTNEFGGYKCNMSIMAGDDIVNHNENMAVMGVDAHFVRVLENNTNTGTTSAVAEISQTVSANEGTGAVTDITIRVANTSETVQTIQAEVDVSAGGVADIIIIVELIYWDLATAPVIAES